MILIGHPLTIIVSVNSNLPRNPRWLILKAFRKQILIQTLYLILKMVSVGSHLGPNSQYIRRSRRNSESSQPSTS